MNFKLIETEPSLWISEDGNYYITRYTKYNGQPREPYYMVYRITKHQSRLSKLEDFLTWEEAVQIAKKHNEGA